MAKRKTKKGNGPFSFFSKKKKGRRSKKDTPAISSSLKVTLGIVLVTMLIAGGAVGLIYLDRYVKTTTAQDVPDGSLKLINPPTWLSQEWIDRLVEATGGKRFPLNQTAAQTVSYRLETLSWLEGVRVQTTPEYLEIRADYRRPVGLVDLGKNKKYYLDAQMVVLDYLPLDTLPLVEIKGIASPRSIPAPGSYWAAEDAQAAVELLDILYTMDFNFQQKDQLEKPLLDEIESIDVSNFAARKSNKEPHLVLNIKDGTTTINWGAAWGQAGRYLEQDGKNKLIDLYQFFMDNNNSLQGTAKYIELRQL